MTFKVGDKVKVVGNTGGGCFPVGHIGEVYDLSAVSCRVSRADGSELFGNNYPYTDLESVEATQEKAPTELTEGADIGYTPKDIKEVDNVNSPSHYGQGEIEAIVYIKDFLTEEEYIGYLRGNIAKYLHRWRYKNGLEDLKKAQVYLGWLIDEVGNG